MIIDKPISFADHFPGIDPLRVLDMLSRMPGSGVYRKRPLKLLSNPKKLSQNKAKAARRARKKNRRRK